MIGGLSQTFRPRQQAPITKENTRNNPFNDWGGRGGCNKFVPVLRGDGSKIAPTGDIFDQPPGGMS